MTIELPTLERVGPMFTPEMAAVLNRNLQRLVSAITALRDRLDPLVQPIDHRAEIDAFSAMGYTPNPGDEIESGEPVRIVGHTTSGMAIVMRADSLSSSTMGADGCASVASSGTFDAPFLVVRRGVIRGMDTSGWAAGAKLYVANGGGLTSTPPAAHIQAVAVVGVVDAFDGTIYVLTPNAAGGIAPGASFSTDTGWAAPTHSAPAKNGVSDVTTYNQLLAIVAAMQEAFMAGKIPSP